MEKMGSAGVASPQKCHEMEFARKKSFGDPQQHGLRLWPTASQSISITFSTLGCLVRPQWTFFNQILFHAMNMNKTHLMRLGLAFWDDQGNEGNLQCAKCELRNPHLARLSILQLPIGPFSDKSFLTE